MRLPARISPLTRSAQSGRNCTTVSDSEFPAFSPIAPLIRRSAHLHVPRPDLLWTVSDAVLARPFLNFPRPGTAFPGLRPACPHELRDDHELRQRSTPLSPDVAGRR